MRGLAPYWCPAQAFATRQGVETYGEVGYAYFSDAKTSYVPISPNAKSVYLHAYRRGDNGPFDNSSRILPKKFLPDVSSGKG